MRPAWIEVDLSAIEQNTRSIQRFVGQRVAVMSIVKADAYGHGLVPVSMAALRGGASSLGVALLEEALAIRAAGVDKPILVLGCGLPEQAPEIVHANLAQVVASREMAAALSREAVRQAATAKVHVKIDTGMGRIGVGWEEGADAVRSLAGLPGLELSGILTHFSTADESDRGFAYEQLSRFGKVLDELAGKDALPACRHAANSAGITFLPESHYDLVRPGLLTYGIPASTEPAPLGLTPALSLKARLAQVKAVKASEGISYGRSHITRRPSTVAIVPFGYGDGFSRSHSNRCRVIVHGQLVPVVGRVCMDQFMVDVTDVADVHTGDEAVILGRQGSSTITAWDLAASMQSVPHEVLSALGARLPRVYIRGNSQ